MIDNAIAVSGAERGFIMLVNSAGALEFALARGPVTRSDLVQISRKIPEQVLATGETQFVLDLHDEMFTKAHKGAIQIGLRTVYCVPVKHVEHPDDTDAARPIGVLYLDSRERGSLNTQAIHNILKRLAAEVAGAIEDARREAALVSRERLASIRSA